MQYNQDPIPEIVELKDAVAVVYGDSMVSEVQDKRLGHLDDVDRLYIPDENESDEDNVSRNTVVVEMTGERDENGAINVCPGYLVDAPVQKNEDRRGVTCHLSLFVGSISVNLFVDVLRMPSFTQIVCKMMVFLE